MNENKEKNKGEAPAEGEIKLAQSPLLKVTLVDNTDKGRIRRIFVREGRTARRVLEVEIKEWKEKEHRRYTTINGERCDLDAELKEGDFICTTSMTIKGAPSGRTPKELKEQNPNCGTQWAWWEGYVRGYWDKSEGLVSDLSKYMEE